MTALQSLLESSLADFARAAAARGPVPGSGSVAAAVGALGAGLASMASGASGAQRGEGPARTGAELAAHMEALLALVQADADAYGSFLAAKKSGQGLNAAVQRAIDVPAEIATLALDALERLVEGFGAVRAHLHSEAATGGQALLAAVEGATFTARSNLPGLADPPERELRAAELERLASRAREAALRLRELLSAAAAR